MRSKPRVEGSSDAGGGLTAAIGTPTTTPTIMIQASTTLEPSIRLEREEQRVAIAHSRAAPRPPMMAVTPASVQAEAAVRGSRREDSAARRESVGPAASVGPAVPRAGGRACGTIRLRARAPLVPHAARHPFRHEQ